MCLKVMVKIPERCQWHRSHVFIVNFQRISHIHVSSGVSIGDFEQVNAGSVDKLQNIIFLDDSSTPAHLHTSISPPKLVTFHWLAISN